MSLVSLESAPLYVVERANATDIDGLLKLYFAVYGANYPLAFGTDAQVMLKTMASPDVLWLVARDPQTGAPVGCVVFEIDRIAKIGKVGGLVIHPECRKQGLAQQLVSQGTTELLRPDGPVNSIYTTTRTNSMGPQLICLRDGFMPLGIFPNAHKLKTYETLTLMAKFKPGVIERRAQVPVVPQKLGPILDVMSHNFGICNDALLQPSSHKALRAVTPDAIEFEFVDAPQFVKNKFMTDIKDPYGRFYPFHTPNFLMVSKDGGVQIFAYWSKTDRYCAIVALNVPVHTLAGRMGRLLEQLKDLGISYLELLMDLEYTQSIEAALQACFLPSAIYPAMREGEDGKLRDFVVLSRTMEMLNFQGMHVDRSFKPFVDQYVGLWKEMHLETLEVYST